MQVFRGVSRATSAEEAVAEATLSFDPGAKLDMVLVFCSTRQDSVEVARVLAERFPDTPIAGCTTAGEHLDGQHFNGAMVVTGLVSPGIRWRTTRVEGLGACDDKTARAAADRVFAALGVARDDVDPQHLFGLIFIDGLSMREEVVAAWVADALEGVPLLGGSAGDDLRFTETRVIEGSVSVRDAFVLVLAETRQGYSVLKHQHFVPTPRTLAVTRADLAQRRVYEMDGVPAADAYARVLGLARADLTDEVTFQHPLTFSCNGELYVRSIQKVHDDGSISLFCALDEGMVLDVGGHEDMVSAFAKDVAQLAPDHGTKAELVIGYNCILRALEADATGLHTQLGEALSGVAESVVGFDTYGEVLHGLHINQTFVGLALHG